MLSWVKWGVFFSVLISFSSSAEASCKRALKFARSASLDGPVASGERILELARVLSLPFVPHVQSAIESMRSQDMVLPRAYPKSFYSLKELDPVLDEWSGSEQSSSDVIFEIAHAEQRLYRTRRSFDGAMTIYWGLRESFSSFVLSNRYGVRILSGGDFEKVYRQEVGFRSDETGTLRKTLAASRLNEALGIHSVPRARPVKLSRFPFFLSRIRPTIESDWAPGDSMLSQPDLVLSQEAKSESEAFEFLVGNADVTKKNMTYDVNQGVFVFDHNFAFIPGFIPVDPQLLWGHSLPRCYTQRFAIALRSMTPNKMIELLAPLLTYQELLWVIFRREILMKHLESLGTQALCGGQQ